MAASAYIHFLLFIVALSALIWLVYGPVRELVTDYGRERIFKTRNRLFLMAARGHISFEDPAYRAMRQSMNQCARYAHQMSWGRLLVYRIMVPQLSRRPSQLTIARDELATRVASPHARRAIRLYRRDIELTMAAILLARSPLLFVALALFAAGWILVAGLNRLTNRVLETGLSAFAEFLRPAKMRDYAYWTGLALIVALGARVEVGIESMSKPEIHAARNPQPAAC